MHIRFNGFSRNHETGLYNDPIEKVIPAEMIGIQKNSEKEYLVEVYYQKEEPFRAYVIDKKEYERIKGLLEKDK